jgi:hypothetical protein
MRETPFLQDFPAGGAVRPKAARFYFYAGKVRPRRAGPLYAKNALCVWFPGR